MQNATKKLTSCRGLLLRLLLLMPLLRTVYTRIWIHHCTVTKSRRIIPLVLMPLLKLKAAIGTITPAKFVEITTVGRVLMRCIVMEA